MIWSKIINKQWSQRDSKSKWMQFPWSWRVPFPHERQNMTVDRMTAPPSSTQQKLHLQSLLPTLKVCYCQSNPKKTVLQFPVSEKTNCFNFLVIKCPYTCTPSWPHSKKSHSICRKCGDKEMCFRIALHEPEGWGLFPHHVIIHRKRLFA